MRLLGESKASDERLRKLNAMWIAYKKRDEIAKYEKLRNQLNREFPFALNNYKYGDKWKNSKEAERYSKRKDELGINDLLKSIEGKSGIPYASIKRFYDQLSSDPKKFSSDYNKLKSQVEKDIEKAKSNQSKVDDNKDTLTPEEEAEYDRLDATGQFTADEIWKMVKSESLESDNYLDKILKICHYSDSPEVGSGWINLLGRFIYPDKSNLVHDDIIDIAIGNGRILKDSMRDRVYDELIDGGLIRINSRFNYIQVNPKRPPNRYQYDSIYEFSSQFSRVNNPTYLTFVANSTSAYKYDNPDDLVNALKNYYRSGVIGESIKCPYCGSTSMRLVEDYLFFSAKKFTDSYYCPKCNKYHKISGIIGEGNKMIESKLVEELDRSFLEATRPELISKARSQTRDKYNKRLGYRPVTFDGVNIRELFTNDDLVFTTKVGNYTDILAVKGVLTELKSNLVGKSRCTYADVLKAINKCLNEDGIRMSCTCADWIYRYRYYATQGGYNYGEGENRPPKVTNPDNVGSMCKHLASLLSSKIWIVKVAAAVNNYIRLHKEECYPYLDLEVPETSPKKPVDDTPNDNNIDNQVDNPEDTPTNSDEIENPEEIVDDAKVDSEEPDVSDDTDDDNGSFSSK